MRLIDADKLLAMTDSYKNELGRLKADPFVKSGIETVEGFIQSLSTEQAIPISEGATNGDIIKAMFSCEEEECVNSIDHRTYYEGLDFED